VKPEPRQAKSLLRQGSSLSLLTLGSRVLGLVREMVKAAYMGTTPTSDAFSVAFLIPNLFRRLFAENSITVAFIPTFRGLYEKADKDQIRSFLSATFTFLTFTVSLTTIAGILLTPQIVPIFGTSTDETVVLTRIMFPYLAIISIAAFFQGMLNGVKIFNPTGFTPILFNLAVISITMVFTPLIGDPGVAMALGVLVGGTIQAGFQLPFVIKAGFRFGLTSLKTALSHPGTREVLRLIGPTIIGMAAYQINDVVSTALAGQAGVGVVSSLSFSLRLQELILGIFAVTIGTIILPGLSSFAAKNQWDSFYSHLTQAVQVIALITLPVSIFAWLNGEEIIILLFRSQAFGDESVRLTLEAFRWHTLGLFFIALNRIIAPAFYAQKDSKSPTWAGLANFGVNILLAYSLVGSMAGGGIALALSLASLANTLVLFWMFRNKPFCPLKTLLKTTIIYSSKILGFSLVAAIPMVFFGQSIYELFQNLPGRLLQYGLPLMILTLIYGLLLIFGLLIFRDPLMSSAKMRLLSRTKNYE
jgi:putative peptidoglycan lipid II flippase